MQLHDARGACKLHQLIETTVTTAAVSRCCGCLLWLPQLGRSCQRSGMALDSMVILYLWIIAHDVKAIKVYTLVWLDYLYTFRECCLRIGLCNFSFTPQHCKQTQSQFVFAFGRILADSDQSTLPAAVPPNSAGVKHLTLPTLVAFCLCF